MPTYKLYYFDAKGRAELTRQILAVGGIDFEDKRVQLEDWPALKPSTPWGYMPFLEVDDQQYGEGKAIARMTAKEAGLAGRTVAEQAITDALVDVLWELLDVFYASVFIGSSFNFIKEEDKPARTAEFHQKLDQVIPNLEKVLLKNKAGDGYFVGDEITWADICLFVKFELMESLAADRLKASPKLFALYNRVKSNDNLSAYLSKRPDTPF